MPAPSRGRLSLVSDPQGAMLLFVRASAGDPVDREPALAGWVWSELWTHDVDAAISLYTDVAGYEVVSRGEEDSPYTVLRSDGMPRAGIVTAPEEVHPTWLPYVRVTDAKDVAARATALGARVVVESETAAIIIDPSGAPIGVQVWSRPEQEKPR